MNFKKTILFLGTILLLLLSHTHLLPRIVGKAQIAAQKPSQPAPPIIPSKNVIQQNIEPQVNKPNPQVDKKIFPNKNETVYRIGKTKIILTQGDITKQKVDAIVNAANENLSHGGGVALAISNAAGRGLQEYSNKMPIISNNQRCPMGNAVITPSFDLAQIGVKKIIHTTGPRGTTPGKEKLLENSYTNSLQLATNNRLRSIAFPAISTAIFGYNINEATPIALRAVKTFVINHPRAFREIRFVLFSEKDVTTYKKYMDELLKK